MRGVVPGVRAQAASLERALLPYPHRPPSCRLKPISHVSSKQMALKRVPGPRIRLQAHAEPQGSSTVTTTSARVQQEEEKEEDADEYVASVVTSIDQVPAEEWDRLVRASSSAPASDSQGQQPQQQEDWNPFVSHTFLSILERSRSACPQEGWAPQHILLRRRRRNRDGKGKGTGAAAAGDGGDAAEAAEEEEQVGELVGAVPLYLKGHSYGEYVFDSSWANYCTMLGQRYYPKLQSCSPFSPVTGPRLLTAVQPGQPGHKAILRALGTALAKVTDALGVSSCHVTFNTLEEAAVLEELGFLTRCGIQFHWDNAGYRSFEDFLGALKQSKRKSIRQERKGVAAQGLRVRRLSGDELRAQGPALWEQLYDFYVHTVDRKWGTAYLTREFFEQLGERMADQVVLIIAEERVSGSSSGGQAAASQQQPPAGDSRGAGPQQQPSASASDAQQSGGQGKAGVPGEDGTGQWQLVGAALNLLGGSTLYGRNWMCAPGREFRFLHFEVCYYSALEEAIARGLPRVEAGAQGEHKLQRGYLPSLTYSSHYIRDPTFRFAVAKFLTREREAIASAWQEMSLTASPYTSARTIDALSTKLARLQSAGTASSVAASFASLDSLGSISSMDST